MDMEVGDHREKRLTRRDESLNEFVRSRVNLTDYEMPWVSGGRHCTRNGSSGDEVRPDKIAPSLAKKSWFESLTFSNGTYHNFTNSVSRKSSEMAVLDNITGGIDNDTRQVKRTCGLTLKPSFQVVLTLPMVLLMIGLAFAIYFPTLDGMRVVVDEINSTCQGGLASTSAFAVTNFEEMTLHISFSLLQEISTNVTLEMLDMTQNVVIQQWTSLEASRSAVGSFVNAENYYGQPSFVPPGFQEPVFNASIAVPMLKGVRYNNLLSINHIYVGYETNEFVMATLTPGTDMGMALTYGYGTPNKEGNDTLVVQYDVPLDSRYPNFSFPLNNFTYSPTSRPWYRFQNTIKEFFPGARSVGLWSDIYLYESGDESGFTFTYPINFCGTYNCFEGVIGADMETHVISKTMQKALGDLWISKDSEPNLRAFIVQNSPTSQYQGVLVASASTTRVDYPTSNFTYAVNSSDAIIRGAATLVSEQLPFGDSAKWDTTITTSTPFECYTKADFAECIACSTSCTRSGDYIITAQAIQSTEMPSFPVAHGIDFALILVIPAGIFFESFDAQMEQLNQEIKQNNTESVEMMSTVLRNDIIIAVCLSLFTIGMTIFVSRAITRPLQKLAKSMLQFKTFQFDDTSPQTFSRVREIYNIQETFVAVRNTLRVFAKFVPQSVVHRIVRNEKNSRVLHVEMKTVTIFFSDIKDFTTISESLSQKELLLLLTKYLSVMTQIVEKFEGQVGEILGDGLLAFWNTPNDVRNHAALACAAALAQQECMTQINQEFREILDARGIGPLQIRIGIHTGKVLTGNIGSMDKMKFGCIGDPVNLAARLEGFCKHYDVSIICSEDTFMQLPKIGFTVRELDEVRAKGKTQSTKIFQVLRVDDVVLETEHRDSSSPIEVVIDNKKDPDMHPEQECVSGLSVGPIDPSHHISDQDIDIYVRALHAFQAGLFQVALDAISNLSKPDKASEHLKSRILQAIHQHGKRVSEHWDGTFNATEK